MARTLHQYFIHILFLENQMAISDKHDKKSPSQDPVSFYKGKDQGGTHGSPQSVPEKLNGGPMREKMMGGSGKKAC